MNKSEINLENKIFYMYRSISENTFKALKKKGVYKSNYRFFNDPFDPFFKQFNTCISESLEKIRISCFTKTNDNLLMWAHYANEHKGICLGYKIKKLEDNVFLDKIIYEPLKVDWDSKRQVILSEKEEELTIYEVFIRKHSRWDYEEEYRLIYLDIENDYYNSIELCEVYFGYECSNEDKLKIIEFLKDQKINYYDMIEYKNLGLKAVRRE